MLNASTRRSLEQPPPEIKMDPLESVAGKTWAARCNSSVYHSLYGSVYDSLQATFLIWWCTYIAVYIPYMAISLFLPAGLASTPLATQFCQAAQQMLSVPSPQLCVPLASGGDPTYAFNVKLAGEEVHGTSKLSECRIIDFEVTSLCLFFRWFVQALSVAGCPRVAVGNTPNPPPLSQRSSRSQHGQYTAHVTERANFSPSQPPLYPLHRASIFLLQVK